MANPAFFFFGPWSGEEETCPFLSTGRLYFSLQVFYCFSIGYCLSFQFVPSHKAGWVLDSSVLSFQELWVRVLNASTYR